MVKGSHEQLGLCEVLCQFCKQSCLCTKVCRRSVLWSRYTNLGKFAIYLLQCYRKPSVFVIGKLVNVCLNLAQILFVGCFMHEKLSVLSTNDRFEGEWFAFIPWEDFHYYVISTLFSAFCSNIIAILILGKHIVNAIHCFIGHMPQEVLKLSNDLVNIVFNMNLY